MLLEAVCSKKFRTRIAEHRLPDVVTRDLFKHSVFSTNDVKIQEDLVCVSFMARSTVNLNSMRFMFDNDSVRLFNEMADIRFQAQCYYEFEKALISFLTDCFLN